ncbi:MAG: TPM domain-containing protein [Desulfobacterales bacterium]|jgi:uncharacterized protein
MVRRVPVVIGLLVCGQILAAAAVRAKDVPYLQGRVTDDAEILSPAAAERIGTLLKAHEKETADQVAVLTVTTLDGESVEDFARRVFEAWQLGQRDQDNGILVVVAPRDRRMRIEVGFGLEGRLTDLEAGRIIRNIMAPRFKAGDYDGGITQGVNAIIDQLQGDHAPILEATRGVSSKSGDRFFEGPDLGIIERLLMGCFIFGIIGLFTVVGVVTPGVGWFIYIFLIPFWAMFPIVVVGTTGAFILLAIYLICFPVAKVILSKSKWYDKAKQDIKQKGRANIGGWTLTSGGGGWRSSSVGRSGGGGFSGGGGSSGGGGASGSW